MAYPKNTIRRSGSEKALIANALAMGVLAERTKLKIDTQARICLIVKKTGEVLDDGLTVDDAEHRLDLYEAEQNASPPETLREARFQVAMIKVAIERLSNLL